MIRVAKFCFRWLWRALLALVLFLNLRLYWPTPLAADRNTAPRQLVAQLNANRRALDDGWPETMQGLFPEGYYFSYALHGLAWVELALRDPSLTERALEQAQDCLAHLDSPEGRAPFPSDLPPDHGMFYSAWKCSLHAGIVSLQKGIDEEELRRLRHSCDEIAAALKESTTPFPQSYTGMSWPCDTAPAIHAFSVYQRVTDEKRYQATIEDWLADSRAALDSDTGLIGHTASLPNGDSTSTARATSQVIILRMLPDIDPAFAREQYERFRERFGRNFFGVPSILEYPSGVTGSGDVDSGPLILGRGVSANVLMIGVAQVYGDHKLANAIAQLGETVGMPWTSGGEGQKQRFEKRYAGGVLPIGDIIVAYSHVARPWQATAEHFPAKRYDVRAWWRLPIHAISALFFLPSLIAYLRVRRRNKGENSQPEEAQDAEFTAHDSGF